MQVSVWRCRGRIPLSVDSYANLLEIQRRYFYPHSKILPDFTSGIIVMQTWMRHMTLSLRFI